MTVKYGDFSSFRLKPTWEDTSKPGRDADGDTLRTNRGARGFANSRDNEIFQKTFDPAADDKAYGRRTGRPNGQQVVMTKTRDPGTITNDGDKGYRGVDE